MTPKPHGQYRPFRPKRTRTVALVLMVVFPAAIILTGLITVGATLFDQFAFIVLALAVGYFLWRQASVAAVPGPEGLVVRNLFITTRLEWSQLVSLRFGDRPWPQLDLSDGDVLAVMGIQRSDGAHARQEAQRLADLIEQHTPDVPDD